MEETATEPKPKLRWYQFQMGSGLEAPLYVTAFFVVLLILILFLGVHARSLFTTFVAYSIGIGAASFFVCKLFWMKMRDDPRSLREQLFQYRLWHLFVLVTVVAIACSWFTCRMQRANRQKETVRVVKELGGRVQYDYYRYETQGSLERRAMVGKPPGPTWVRNLVGLDFLSDVTVVSLRGPKVTDAVIQHLESLTNLEELRLDDTSITDEGIKGLRQALPYCRIHH